LSTTCPEITANATQRDQPVPYAPIVQTDEATSIDRGPARPAILVLVDWYPPAYRAGGPTRSVPGIVQRLGEDFDFKVITGDRDLGQRARLPGVVPNRWVQRGKARCLYLSASRRRIGGLWTSIRAAPHDSLYLNSIFSIEFGLFPLLLRRAHLIPRRGLVVAPRGQTDRGALHIKWRRKQVFLSLARRLGLFNDVVWHATSSEEATAIANTLGHEVLIVVAPAIPVPILPDGVPLAKVPGALELVFLSRIARMKNLEFAIAALERVQGNVTLDIYGPIEDVQYWADCQHAADRLPPTVRIHYRGVLEPDDIGRVLTRHHVFFLPTKGENFGHAIVESLLAGCPVLISDLTPWHNLEERRAGWDLSLADPEAFARVVQHLVSMSAEEWASWSDGARRLGTEIAANPEVDESYRALFRATIA
jgi:glycosyltransferase involved in cell wall biosynthesis